MGTCTETATAAGATNADACTVTIPAGQALGAYYLGVIADSTNVITETFENNNTGYDPVTVTALPDLAVTNVQCAATTIGRGQAASCVVTIQNQGTAASPAYSYRLYLSTNNVISTIDTVIGTCSAPVLAAGATTIRLFTGTIPAGQAVGNYYIGAIADDPPAITEESETNNAGGADPVAIVATGTPDLIVSLVACPATVARGATLSCTVQIRNSGSALAGASTAQLRLSPNTTISIADTLLGSCSIAALLPGQTQTTTCSGTIPTTTAVGAFYGGIMADRHGECGH